jgi:hypothetical protein
MARHLDPLHGGGMKKPALLDFRHRSARNAAQDGETRFRSSFRRQEM